MRQHSCAFFTFPFIYLAVLSFLAWNVVLTLRYKHVLKVNLMYHNDIASAKQELLDTIRQQQGMIFKFTKVDGQFIHTLCDGELLYKMALRPEQVVGKTLYEFVEDEQAARVKENFYRRAWEGHIVTYEDNANGVWYLATLRPIFKYGKVVEVIASCVDITEKKATEEALRQSEDIHRLITENTEDLIQIIDSTSKILYANPSHERVLGYHPAELIGVESLSLMLPEDRERVQELFQKACQDGTPALYEYRLRDHNGQALYFESRGVPVRDRNGNHLYTIVISRDITSRRKAEENLLRTEKLTMAGQLAAGVAHEIRNPLTTAKGFIQLIKERSSATEHQFFDFALSELTQIENIINEFLMLSKPQLGDEAVIRGDEVLRQVVTLLEPQALLRNVELSLTDTFPARVRSAEFQLKQVFVNVMKNAIESMPSGGAVHVSMTDCGDTVNFVIQDEGPGIPMERLKRIGEPFFTTKENGTGLGLMVSHRIIRNFGGDIQFHSEVGKGTTVQITLPVVRSQESSFLPDAGNMVV
jgi:PAS domain S-box-containing protein